MANSMTTVAAAKMSGTEALDSSVRRQDACSSKQPITAAPISAQALEAHAAAADTATGRSGDQPKPQNDTTGRQGVTSCSSTEAGSTTGTSSIRRPSSSGSSDSLSCGSPSSSEQEDPSPAFHGCRASTPAFSRDQVLTSRFLDCFIKIALLSHLKVGGSHRKMLQDCLKFLYACEYEFEEICSILAHACYYFEDFYSRRDVEDDEAVYILITEVYIAHCYVVDECVILNSWHRRFFQKYCTMRILDQAVLQLMMERNFCLRLPDAEFSERYEALVSF